MGEALREDTTRTNMEQHIEYIRQLAKSLVDLIIDRDATYRGSWKNLVEAKPDRQADITLLRNYELQNDINLGSVLQYYRRLNDPGANGALDFSL